MKDAPCHQESSKGWPTAGLCRDINSPALTSFLKALRSQGNHGDASGQKEVARGMFLVLH